MMMDRLEKAVKLDPDDMEVKMTGRKDETTEAELRSKRIDELVAKIVLLGQKRGRPKKFESFDEAA